MSSYSSSNLDEDLDPVYTAYNPKRGVAWAPRVVHVYDDRDGSSDDTDSEAGGFRADGMVVGARPRKPQRPIQRRSSALSLSASLSSVFGSLTNLLSTPKLGRKTQTGPGIADVDKKTTVGLYQPTSTAPSPVTNRSDGGGDGGGGVKGSDMPPFRKALLLKSRSKSDSSVIDAQQRRCVPNSNSFRRNRKLDSGSAKRTKPAATVDTASTYTAVIRPVSGRSAPMMAFRSSSNSRESLPSINSDKSKSSIESPDDNIVRPCSNLLDKGFEDLSPGGSSSGYGSPHNTDGPSFSDMEENNGTLLNLRTLFHGEDASHLAIDRRYLRTGRLVINEHSRAVCCGSLRTKSQSYSSRIRAVTIHIHKGVDDRVSQMTLVRDVMSLRRLRHRHVVETLGLCMEGSPRTPGGTEVLVVTERAHFHVNLRRLVVWVGENNPQLLTPQIISTFGIQICHGLRYLEKHKILHTNLTTATVFLDTRCVCKLHDVHFQALEDRALNTRWLPLESFLQSLYTFKSVVWSMGVLLWELASLCIEQPYPHLTTLNDIILYLAHGKRLIRPETCPKKLYRIMWHCWSEKPRSRPTLDDLIVMMTSFRQTLPAGKPPEEVFQDRDDFWEDNSWMDELDGVYDITMM